MHRCKRPQTASALTQGAKAAADFFISAIFAFAGFAGALKSHLERGMLSKKRCLTKWLQCLAKLPALLPWKALFAGLYPDNDCFLLHLCGCGHRTARGFPLGRFLAANSTWSGDSHISSSHVPERMANPRLERGFRMLTKPSDCQSDEKACTAEKQA